MESINAQGIKVLFFGSGNFAVPVLEKLLQLSTIDVRAVVTQPDKAAGREKSLLPTPVSAFISQKAPNVVVFKPASLKQAAVQILEKTKPDLIIVADYGQFLPTSVINYPKFKCINIHGSLLPDLRGAVPIPIAILRGYKRTGISVAIMTAGLDNGPVLAQAETDIANDDDTQSLSGKLAALGAQKLAEILPLWISNQITPVPQAEELASFVYEKDIAKENARFSITNSAEEIDRMVRAFYPWPVAWTVVKMSNSEQRLKILRMNLLPTNDLDISELGVIKKINKTLYLKTEVGGKIMELNELQLEGKKVGQAIDYLYLHNIALV